MGKAVKTMEAINAAMFADQGAAYRGWLGQLMPLAGDAYRTESDDWRDHLGASLLGRECAREIWYGFHWATLKRFDARMLRLFNRGHLEEPRMLALLKMIGCNVWQVQENGKQFRIKGHRGHFGGSLDGVALGIPDMPTIPVLTEFKTHGEKSFLKLQSEGLLAAKWEHYVQMQIYMGKMELTHGLYMATNKNTDEIETEIIQFDKTQYDRYEQRSIAIIEAKEPPPRINNSPGFFKCKFCDHSKVCHLGGSLARNCRTCVHSSVGDDAAWICGVASPVVIDGERQRLACDRYEANRKFHNKT